VAAVGELVPGGDFRHARPPQGRRGQLKPCLLKPSAADVRRHRLPGRGERPVQRADRDVELAGQRRRREIGIGEAPVRDLHRRAGQRGRQPGLDVVELPPHGPLGQLEQGVTGGPQASRRKVAHGLADRVRVRHEHAGLGRAGRSEDEPATWQRRDGRGGQEQHVRRRAAGQVE
jgi:hypothetical protein